MDRDAYVEFDELQQGFYYVWVRMDWHECVAQYKGELVFNLNAYGPARVSLVKDPAEYPDKIKFLEKLFTSHAETLPGKPASSGAGIDVKLYEPEGMENGYSFALLKNDDKKATYTEESTFPRFEGLKLLDNHAGKDGCTIGADSYKMVVGPGQKKLVILEALVKGYAMS